MRSSIIFGVTLLSLGLACGTGDDTSTTGIATTPSGQVDPMDDPAVAPPSTLAEVTPTFLVSGDTDSAPRSMAVLFARRVITDDQVGKPADIQVTFDPPVPGTWTWVGPDRAQFRPENGFPPDKTFAIELTEAESQWGKLGGTFQHVLSTPPLAFKRVSVAGLTRETVTVETVFNGPVAEGDHSKVAIKLGRKVLKRTFSGSQSPDRYQFVIDRKQLPETQLSLIVDVAAGVKSRAADIRAPSGRHKIQLDTTFRKFEVKTARLKESEEGYYIRIVCDDDAGGPESYWWDRETYDSWELSERCNLSPDALSSLVFEPAVDNVRVSKGLHGFNLFGDFKQGDVKLRLNKGAYTTDGGLLNKNWSQNFTVPKRTPNARMVAKQGRYLPKGAWGNLPVRHLNTDKVRIQVRQVPPENLAFWLSNDDEAASTRTANLVAEKWITVNNPTDRVETTWIDVAGMVKGRTDGLFEIRVHPENPNPVETTSDDTGWSGRRRQAETSDNGDVSRIVLTDLHLIAKESGRTKDSPWSDRIQVFAIDANTSAPESGVEIDAIRASGFVMATCTTDSQGTCDLRLDTKDPVDTSPPIALIARRGEDRTYLKFDDLRTPIAESDVAGAPWSGEAPYTASLYTDRGVYRPGDTAHFAWTLRNADFEAEAGVPVELEIKDPQRKSVRKVTQTTDDNGVSTFDLSLGDYATTGSWRAILKVGGDRILQESFSVEEFVPERMKVNASLRDVDHLAPDTNLVNVDARYLFGGSAEGSKVEVACSVSPSTFRPKQNKNFHYGAVFVGDESAPRELTLASETTMLKTDGASSVPCGGLTDAFPVTGKLKAEVAVFESGSGRSSKAFATANIHPERFYVGLDTSVDTATRGTTIPVDGIVVDWQGAAGPHTKTVELTYYTLEEEYGWWWWDRGDESLDLYLRRVEESRETVNLDANGRFRSTFTPKRKGAGYLVRAQAGNARTDLRIQGKERRYYWQAETRVDRTPRPAKPTDLRIDLPGRIKVGETVTAKLDIPYKGRILYTLEANRLITHEWADVEPGPTTWNFQVPGFLPDVYVSAFLVKDTAVDSPEGHVPERAFGVTGVRVEPEAFTLPVQLTVPKEVRSNSTLKVDVDLGKAGASATVTLAAVDEGILQLTNFETPNPLDDIFARRRLDVKTYETVGWSLMMPAGPSSSHGGDGGGGMGRVQPVKPVALWSGPLTAGPDGTVTVSLDVPQYRGQLRVMAVATSKSKMGSADARVLVRDPLVLQTTLPRFLTHDDHFSIPVFVTNLSGKKQTIDVTVDVDDLPWPGMDADPTRPDPVQFVSARKQTVTLEEGASITVPFDAKAVAMVGAAHFTVKVQAGNLVSYDELDVPFSPAAPRERNVQQVELTGGKVDIAPYLTGWLPTTERTSLWVTTNPYGESFGHLKSVVQYPHGCIEQTTSSTRPLLYVRDIAPAVAPSLDDAAIADRVRHGIERILSMQTPSGGFAYWPGRHDAVEWGTAYATHMLLDAKKLQHDVPQARIDDAIRYLENEVQQPETTKRWRRSARAYSHYVLARAGKPQKAAARNLLETLPAEAKRSGEEREQAYLLKAALYQAGDRTHEAALRAPDARPITKNRSNSWSFYSDLRRRGMQLTLFHELFGDQDPGAEDLAQAVARRLAEQRSGYYTTQEMVWGITGLGRRVSGGSKNTVASLEVDGATVATAAKSGQDPRWSLARASERKSLVLDVDKPTGRLWLVISSEGVKENAVMKTGGTGLSIARSYKDRDGNPVALSDIQLGDVVYASVVVSNTSSESIQNLALVDRFPAGFEIENPRLGRGSNVDWIDADQAWDVDHMDLRDDRLAMFGTLSRNEKRTIVYALRAVTAGAFHSPPAEIEAMYDPTLWARQAGRPVTIQAPWAQEPPK